MKRLILSFLAPVIEWATSGKTGTMAVYRDHTGAYEVFICPCGLQLCTRLSLDSVRDDQRRRMNAAYDHAEGVPELGPEDLQTY